MVGTLEVIVQEASKVKIVLPNVSALKDALYKAKEWTNKVEHVQVKTFLKLEFKRKSVCNSADG